MAESSTLLFAQEILRFVSSIVDPLKIIIGIGGFFMFTLSIYGLKNVYKYKEKPNRYLTGIIVGFVFMQISSVIGVLSYTAFENDSLNSLSYAQGLRGTELVDATLMIAFSLCYLLGYIFFVNGWLHIRDLWQDPRQVRSGLIRMIASICLINMPNFLSAFGEQFTIVKNIITKFNIY